MDHKNNLTEELSVPVPKPRRQNVNIETNLKNKTPYENVSIDLINKNVNIKDENLQNNAKNNKLQTNKLFLMPTTSANLTTNDATSPQQILTNLNDLANASNKYQKNIPAHLDEVNKLSNIYNDDENANVKPVPAPRQSSATTKLNKSFSNQINCSPSTGAINKQSNKLSLDDFIDTSPKAKTKVNKSSGSYNFMPDDTDANANESHTNKFALKKTISSSSLSSSPSESSTNDGIHSKYHSASPG